MVRMIKEKVEVLESDKKKTFSKGEKREDFAAAWSDAGNALLAGVVGSGRRELAELMAGKMQVQVFEPADAETLKAACESGGVIVPAPELFEDEALRMLMNRSGKVFYLMTDTRTLAGRLAERDGGNADEMLEEVSAERERMEPFFMQTLHFILQGAEPAESLAENALEKMQW